MSKIRLWLSRNGFKILLICICIIVFYILIKSTNKYYEREKEIEQSTKNTTQNIEQLEEKAEQNINSNTSESEEVENNPIYQELDKSSAEFKEVSVVTEKLLSKMYNAKINTDDNSKQEVYNMFSEELYSKVFNSNGTVTSTGNSILNYIFNIDDIDNYSINKIYKFSDNNNVARYIVEQVYKVDNGREITIYMIINIDSNNNTFSYDGNVSSIEDVKDDKIIDQIENKGSNTFE